MTEDPARAENMHLRAELTVQRALHTDLQREHAHLTDIHTQTATRLAEILGSSTWRLALQLVDAAERVPGPLRRIVGAGLRRVRGTPPAIAEPPPTPAPPPPRPAIPSHAEIYGVFTQSDASLAGNPWFDAVHPRVSVIILNWNRSEMTLACIRYVLRHTAGVSFEIVVADNGSEPADLALLHASPLPMRVLPLGTNLFFGEANNVAAERARGDYLAFLNNDAFVHDGWLPPLVDALEAVPNAGAAGSQLRYPTGRLQEAGSLISPDGVAHQIGKNEDPADERFNSLRLVDYVSAAAMLMRRADFLDVLGFELRYEPAYYEDVDLCLKLRARGQSIVYCPASVVTHVENATSLDSRLSLQLGNVIQANRVTFVSHWGKFLLGFPPPAAAPARRPPAQHPQHPAVVLHSPYMLTPGGGERYLLGAGEALAEQANVTLLTTFPCSDIRLRRLGIDLDLDLSGIALRTAGDAADPAGYDTAIVMGNSLLPPIPGPARDNVYICQFPFPMPADKAAAWHAHWADYRGLVVYSDFARQHVEAARVANGLPPRSISVIAPPVKRRHAGTKLRRILSVGRFFAGQHCKRQDVMIEAFRTLVADGTQCELHLAGSLRPEPQHRAFYVAITEAAKDLPVTIHPNAGPDDLAALFASSCIYWHLTGIGTDFEHEPELSEHFGISLVEAMSAGCVPVAYGRGGPAETVTDGVDGYLVDDIPALLDRTRDLLADGPLRTAMAAAAAANSARFDEVIFAQNIRSLVSGTAAGSLRQPAPLTPQLPNPA